jgi:hypothetical protein
VGKTTRNFQCEFTGAACQNPKCKRGFCALEREEEIALARLPSIVAWSDCGSQVLILPEPDLENPI